MDIKDFNRKRVILGIALTPAIFCLITYPLRFHLFGQYQYKALIVCILLAALVMHFNGPSLEEVRQYHDQKIKADREAHEAERDDKRDTT